MRSDQRLDAGWKHVWMRPCTLRMASATDGIKATSLNAVRVEHPSWCRTAPAALPTHIKPQDARALALIESNSAWEIAPESSSPFAFSISPAAPPLLATVRT